MPNNEAWEKRWEVEIEEPWLKGTNLDAYVVKDFIRDQITLARREETERVLNLAIKEIAQAHKEGSPTKRLTSLYNKVHGSSPTSITRNEEMQ